MPLPRKSNSYRPGPPPRSVAVFSLGGRDRGIAELEWQTRPLVAQRFRSSVASRRASGLDLLVVGAVMTPPAGGWMGGRSGRTRRFHISRNCPYGSTIESSFRTRREILERQIDHVLLAQRSASGGCRTAWRAVFPNRRLAAAAGLASGGSAAWHPPKVEPPRASISPDEKAPVMILPWGDGRQSSPGPRLQG